MSKNWAKNTLTCFLPRARSVPSLSTSRCHCYEYETVKWDKLFTPPARRQQETYKLNISTEEREVQREASLVFVRGVRGWGSSFRTQNTIYPFPSLRLSHKKWLLAQVWLHFFPGRGKVINISPALDSVGRNGMELVWNWEILRLEPDTDTDPGRETGGWPGRWVGNW